MPSHQDLDPSFLFRGQAGSHMRLRSLGSRARPSGWVSLSIDLCCNPHAETFGIRRITSCSVPHTTKHGIVRLSSNVLSSVTLLCSKPEIRRRSARKALHSGERFIKQIGGDLNTDWLHLRSLVSGGQKVWHGNFTVMTRFLRMLGKARITLARAVYSSAEILLLDDVRSRVSTSFALVEIHHLGLQVLAALDVHTGRWIVDKCFRGDLIRGRTVILVVSLRQNNSVIHFPTIALLMTEPQCCAYTSYRGLRCRPRWQWPDCKPRITR